MDELKKQAEELGIEVDGRWSEKRIQSEIDKALAADPVPAVKSQSFEININPTAGMDESDASDKVARMIAKIGPKTHKAKEGMIIKNMRPNPMKRLGLPGFGFCTLTDEQMGNEQFMKRIRHGIETGALSEL